MTTANTSTRWPLLEHDQVRLEYGRLVWRSPEARERLLRHWTNPEHPCADRFVGEIRAMVEWLLSSTPDKENEIDAELREKGWSLRALVREIPPVFGSFC
jgi:hypothetical protein